MADERAVEEDDDDPAAPGATPDVIVSRGQPVMLASRVAFEFGVETRVVNQAVKRNPQLFTTMHTFELDDDEVDTLKSQAVTSKAGRGGSRARPRVFTQKGVLRLASVLKSPRALAATELMIDVFVDVYQQLANGASDLRTTTRSKLITDAGDKSRLVELRQKLLDAVDSLLSTVVNVQQNVTVRDELAEVGSSALGMLKAHLNAKSLENDKIAADTLLVLEQIHQIRAKTAAEIRKSDADVETVNLTNFDKRISIVERLLKLTSDLEPNAAATLLRELDLGEPPRPRRVRLLEQKL